MRGFGSDPVPGMDDFAEVALLEENKATAIALKLVNGPLAGSIFPIVAPAAVIGRHDPPTTIVDMDLTDAEIGATPMISRRHAKFDWNSSTGELFIADLGSTNGTWVGSERLSPGAAPRLVTLPLSIRLANLEFEIFYVEG